MESKPVFNDDILPVYDFENDNTISDKRKEACRLSYLDMQLHHIDKIFTSTFVYDKKTGEPIAKKPKSLHELVFFMLKSIQDITQEIHVLKHEVREVKMRLKEKPE